MAGITVKIGGVDKTEYVDARTLSIRDELTSKVNSASFDFISNSIAVAPKPGEAVLIEEGAKKLFSGRVLSKEESFLPPNLLKYPVECIDYTRDLDKKLVAESYKEQKAGDIYKHIIDNYTAGFTYVNVSDGPDISEIAFDYIQVSEALTKIVEICGYEWYVDYDKDIHFFAKNTYPAPFQLDDNQADYKDLIINTDVSQLRNRVFVKSSGYKEPYFSDVFIGDGVTSSWPCTYKYIAKDCPSVKLPDPANLPGSKGCNVTFSPDDIYLVVGFDTSPYMMIYKRNNDTFTKLADPADMPTGTVWDASFSSDGVYLAVVFPASPFLIIYKRSGDTFTKLSNPDVMPAGNGWGVDFSSDDLYLAIAHDISPRITIYKRSGDIFTKLADPDIIPTETGWGVAFSPDTVYLALGYRKSIVNQGQGYSYIMVYKRDEDTFTRVPKLPALPNDCYNVSWSPDGIYLAAAHDDSSYITVYKRNKDNFTKLLEFETLPKGNGADIDFSPDGVFLAVSHTNFPYVTFYKHIKDEFSKLPELEESPTGNGTSIDFSSDNLYLAIAHEVEPYISIYKQHTPRVTLNGVNQTVGWDGLDNPDDFDFMFNHSTKILSLGTYTSNPADGDEIILSYGITKSVMLKREDQDSIDKIQAIEGGDGIFEFCLVDNNIDSIAWANEAAKADLLKNADPTLKATFITNRSDIRSGQIITLFSTKRNINQQFIVQSVELVRVDVLTEWPTIPYKPADQAEIGYKPASEAEKGYRAARDSGGIIYYIFNVTIANKFRKLEDLFIYLLNRTDESIK